MSVVKLSPVTYSFITCYIVSYFIFPYAKFIDERLISKPFLYDGVKFYTIMLSVLGICFFFLGYYIRGRFPIVVSSFSKRKLGLRSVKFAKLISVVFLSFLFLYAFSLYGVAIFIDRTEAFRGNGILLFLFNSFLVLFCSFSLIYYRLKGNLVSLLFDMFLIMLFSAGSRSLLVLYILFILFTFIQQRGFLSSISKVVPMAVFLGIIAIVLPAIRQPTDDGGVPSWLIFRILANTFQEGEFFSILVNKIDYGLHNVEAFFGFVYIFLPRVFFPEKPLVWGKAVYEVELGLKDPNSVSGTSYAFGQLSELYAPFGVFGLVIGMFIWGAIFCSLDRQYWRREVSSVGGISVVLFHFGLFWVFRHGFLGLIQYSVLLIPSALVVYFIIRFLSSVSNARSSL